MTSEKNTQVRTIMLKVGGLHCENCANTLKNSLSSIEGVSDAKVDFDNKRATVIFNPKLADEAKLRKTIEDVGYSVG